MVKQNSKANHCSKKKRKGEKQKNEKRLKKLYKSPTRKDVGHFIFLSQMPEPKCRKTRC